MLLQRLYLIMLVFASQAYTQTQTGNKQKHILSYTPSKLLSRGQWDIKLFNNLYTETKGVNENGVQRNYSRRNFFTSSLEIFTSTAAKKQWNLGLVLDVRSNTIDGRPIIDALKFANVAGQTRFGISSIGPALKFSPISSLNNFTIQTTFSIPLLKQEVQDEVFLDQKGFTWQNRFFYDLSLKNGMWQLFSELNTEFNFGKKDASFANNSLRLTPGIFLSYFPIYEWSLLILLQHSELLDLGNQFYQNYTAIGAGTKLQWSTKCNLELLYTRFIKGNSTGLGSSYNLGIRVLL